MRLKKYLGAAAAAFGIVSTAHAADAPPPPPAPTVIHAGQLLETPGKAPLEHATLVVQGGRVKEVRPGFVDPRAVGLPAGTRVVDLSNMFVMPGFIDLHVHLSSGGPK